MSDLIQQLSAKGIQIPDPSQVYIAEEINPEQIEAEVILYPGARLEGGNTWIGKGSKIGAEGPAVLKNCKLGRNVVFGGGFAEEAIMLDGASSGLGAHFRAGTLLEEKASVAHTVGLKQTILMPYVTLGSLINFCDILMAGGTGNQNHGEVGSSYIHFNFTPQQDKATASLIGDVPRGVCLKQPPIFLGGQGGLVGPCRIEFGNLVAAGCICREDILSNGQLHQSGSPSSSMTMPYDTSSYRKVERKILNNLHFIGNLYALRAWYEHVKLPFYSKDVFEAALMQASIELIDGSIDERFKRMDQFLAKLEKQSNLKSSLHEFITAWPTAKSNMQDQLIALANEDFISPLQTYVSSSPLDYLATLAQAEPTFQSRAQEWLETYVNNILNASK